MTPDQLNKDKKTLTLPLFEEIKKKGTLAAIGFINLEGSLHTCRTNQTLKSINHLRNGGG